MKKILLIITTVLALCAACLAGCNDNGKKGNDGIQEKAYDLIQEMKDGDNKDGDCRDGGCDEKEDNEIPELPDIGFRKPRRRHDRPIPIPTNPVKPEN